MFIIVESGATKTDWCAVPNGKDQVRVRTAGLNLSVMSEETVEVIIKDAIASFAFKGVEFNGLDQVEAVYFYAAGLIVQEDGEVPALAKDVDSVLRKTFPGAVIEYSSDLLAAARAVCGHKPGIAAILGTGSNSCFFDGKRVVKNVHPGGFILGDEGGGACLGRMFLSDFIKGLVPEPVASEFSRDFKADYLTIVENVYRGDAPSKYLGSFAPWIMERYDSNEYVRKLVDANFSNFIIRCLKQYDIMNYPVGIVGGFGHAHQKVFRSVAERYGIRLSKIISAPIDGLVEYHLSK